MPFGEYKDFAECERKNSDKESPGGYCAMLHKKITGKYPNEASNEDKIAASFMEENAEEQKKIEEKKKNCSVEGKLEGAFKGEKAGLDSDMENINTIIGEEKAKGRSVQEIVNRLEDDRQLAKTIQTVIGNEFDLKNYVENYKEEESSSKEKTNAQLTLEKRLQTAAENASTSYGMFNYRGFDVKYTTTSSGYIKWNALGDLGSLTEREGGDLGQSNQNVEENIKSFIDRFLDGGNIPSGIEVERYDSSIKSTKDKTNAIGTTSDKHLGVIKRVDTGYALFDDENNVIYYDNDIEKVKSEAEKRGVEFRVML